MDIPITQIHENAILPNYQTTGSAAADISACIDEQLVLKPGARVVVPTGLSIAVPPGYEAQIRARSGLSSKHGICLANGIGTIDSDYRGEIGVILINLGNEPFTVEPGMRIAQLAIARVEQATWQQVDKLDETKRGDRGYGSTGH